ncbi:MAG: DUF4214 domain-containing protein [Desulfuromonadales bacterium]|nr:DUF4214 domain-containing protein [Desulfuromonadales bacterium]
MKQFLKVGIWSLLLACWATTAFAATITGNVINSSGQTGRIFLRVFFNNGGPGYWGVSIANGVSSYSIRGVPDGSYFVVGYVDRNADGIPNSSEAVGMSGVINITSDAATGSPHILFNAAGTVAPTAATQLGPLVFDNGVLLFWDPPRNDNGQFEVDSYIVEWSTNNFSTILGTSGAFPAGGGMEDGMYLISPMTPGTYQFRVTSVIGAQTVISDVVEATVAAPSGGVTVSGTISLPGAISVPANTPIVLIVEGVGGEQVFLDALPSFANGTAFSVGGVANGYYHLWALVDMNKDNRFSAGDYTTNAIPITVNGTNVTGQTLTVANPKAVAFMEIEHGHSQNEFVSEFYGVSGCVESGSKRPVNIYMNGPAFSGYSTGVDLAWDDGDACYWQWDDTRPQLSDQYSFVVEYADGTPGETLYANPTAVYDSPLPGNVTPTGNITAMPANITWTASAPLPAGWVVDVNIMGWSNGFYWEPNTTPAADATSVAYDGQTLPAGSYYLNVKFCEDWNWNCVSRNEMINVVVGTCLPPSSIAVATADLDGDGNYQVTWGTSGTPGVAYVLEEATNSGFTSNLRTVPGATASPANITGRTYGTTYYYRVKATKTDYADSSWQTTGNGIFIGNPDDIDGDMIPAASDNCPNVNNPSQSDANTNGIGDACDTGDSDSDGLADNLEVQAGTSPSNPDTDGDGLKDGIDTQPLAYQTPLTDNTAFVRQVYLDFLNREPDVAGLQYWAGELTAGRRTKEQVVEQYLLSAEFGEKVAPVARLYFAYFLRIPDYGGLMYWVGEYASGRLTLNDISNFFASSTEFQTAYSSLDNGQFVDLIYTNLFNRAPDPGGRTYWVSELDAGNRTRGEVMTFFSDSSEYKTLMGSEIYVTMTYIGLLRRSPDQGGYDYWVGAMDGGSPGLSLISGFLASQEYQGRFPMP